MNNPFDYEPDPECALAYEALLARLDSLKSSDDPDDIQLCAELEAGKMLGVLIAADSDGTRHTLYAFSGQIADRGFHLPGFVEPPFDYLDPKEYFKSKERDISLQNAAIAELEAGPLTDAFVEYEQARKQADAAIQSRKESYKQAKAARDARRKSGETDEAELAEMIRQSQFEKAELRRLRKRLADELRPLVDKLEKHRAQLAEMKAKRRADSEHLQHRLFSDIRLLNALGNSRSVSEIFADTPLGIPPSGAGECCAPKLLQAAYTRGLTPVAMAEYWYGRSKEGEVRIHGEHYPACRGKCQPILQWMLQGLDVTPPLGAERHPAVSSEPKILFENEWFCVVDKPSGMLSVPGRTGEPSVAEWLKAHYASESTRSDVKAAHRLDRDTSGLIIATFGAGAFRLMQALFASRRVAKTYIADLEGDYKALGKSSSGRIALPMAPDYLDRPRQRVDAQVGKPSLTDYEFLSVQAGRSRVAFHPLTGRTHQLRVHAASEAGLGMPIVGDPLYGKSHNDTRDRLHLHAQRIEFRFPIDDRQYIFESTVPF